MKKMAPITFIYMMIIVISIVALTFGILVNIPKFTNKKSRYNENNSETMAELVNNFNTIFNNELRGDTEQLKNVNKKDNGKNIVYTGYEKKEKKDKLYDINISIPRVNIDCEVADKFNKKMEKMFLEKINNIITIQRENAMFTVEYTGYINEDILSVVVRASLKENSTTPQRVIIQTFNLNLSNNKEVKLKEILNSKKLNENLVENNVKKVITDTNEQAQELSKLGYEIYTRDVNSDIYKIDNTTEYFLGENNKLYLIYAYGNKNFTSEIYILTFQ